MQSVGSELLIINMETAYEQIHNVNHQLCNNTTSIVILTVGIFTLLAVQEGQCYMQTIETSYGIHTKRIAQS